MNNDLTIFGCRHTHWFTKYRLDKNTEIMNTIPGIHHFMGYTRPWFIESLLENKSKFDLILDGGKEYLYEDSWKKSFQNLDLLIRKYDYKKIFLFFTPINDDFVFGNENKIEELYQKCLENDKYGLDSYLTKNIYKRIMMIYYFNKICNIPLSQFIDDPLECDFTKFNPRNKRYFYYENKRINCSYYPYAEYGFVYKNKRDYFTIKNYDFTFGMTSVMDMDYRELMINKLMGLEEYFKHNHIRYNFFFKNRSRTLNNYVSGQEYNDKYIAQSRYTMIIPAYDTNEFSLIRLIEAIDRGCIPLIHIDCKNWEFAMKNYPDWINIYKKHGLFTDENGLIKKIKNTYYNIVITELTQSPDYLKLLSNSYYESYSVS